MTRIGNNFYLGGGPALWRYPVSGTPADAVQVGVFHSDVESSFGFATDGTNLYVIDNARKFHRLLAANLATPGSSEILGTIGTLEALPVYILVLRVGLSGISGIPLFFNTNNNK